MAETNPTPPLNIESLTALGARLTEHADFIVDDIASDLRLAAYAAGKLVQLRTRVAEITENAIEVAPGIADALRLALADADATEG